MLKSHGKNSVKILYKLLPVIIRDLLHPQIPPGCNRDTVPVPKSRGAGQLPTPVLHKTILLDWGWLLTSSPSQALAHQRNLQPPNFSRWAVKAVPSLRLPTWPFLLSLQPLNTNEMSFETPFVTPLSSLPLPLRENSSPLHSNTPFQRLK